MKRFFLVSFFILVTSISVFGSKFIWDKYIDYRLGSYTPKEFPYVFLFEDNDAGSNITITTSSVWYPWVSASTTYLSSGVIVNVSHTTSTGDGFVVATSSRGLWEIGFNSSFSDGVNHDADVTILINGVTNNRIQCHRKTANNDKGSCASSGYAILNDGDRITVGTTNDTSGQTNIIYHFNLFGRRVLSL